MIEKTIYALGFFDGVHVGHQALLTACRQLADDLGIRAGAVTFTAHPDTLVLGNTPALINTHSDRNILLRQHHIDNIVQLPFNKAMMTMRWQDFICMLRSEYGAAGFVCGNDFRFGHKGEGTADILRQYCSAAGMPCTVVPEQVLDGTVVSSTHIRRLLEDGNVAAAARFLGHPHSLSGLVVSGRQLGRTLGIPTANLEQPEGVVELKHGVYACKAIADNREYPAVTNVGSRPTVGGHHVTVEAFLLDFDGDLYGKELTLLFYEFLRPEQKFDSLEDLKEQICRDTVQTRKLLG